MDIEERLDKLESLVVKLVKDLDKCLNREGEDRIQIDALERKNKTPFDFENKQYYYRILSNGEVDKISWRNEQCHRNHNKQGSIFKTRKLAERERDKRALITEIWQWFYENDGVLESENKYLLVSSPVSTLSPVQVHHCLDSQDIMVTVTKCSDGGAVKLGLPIETSNPDYITVFLPPSDVKGKWGYVQHPSQIASICGIESILPLFSSPENVRGCIDYFGDRLDILLLPKYEE